jgi:hypothetical protein
MPGLDFFKNRKPKVNAAAASAPLTNDDAATSDNFTGFNDFTDFDDNNNRNAFNNNDNMAFDDFDNVGANGDWGTSEFDVEVSFMLRVVKCALQTLEN